MFETILEKLLINTAGQFVTGIDKKNLKLGIWSGDIVIGNITVKPEVFKMLNLPVVLKYSSIGKLKIQISWTSLASQPVVVILEDVFVVVQPSSQDSWVQDEAKLFERRMELVESLTQEFIKRIQEKAQAGKEEAGADQGMVGKLTEKIIDNLQISVKNIHIRFENPFVKRKYAWGITLNEVDVHTTDANWAKKYIDRTQSENKLLPMNKLLTLKNLGVYWASNTGTNQFIGDLEPAKAIEAMKSWIVDPAGKTPKRPEYIIMVSINCKFIQKNKNSPWVMKPDFDVGLQLAPIDIQLNKLQLEDTIMLLEFMNTFEQHKTKGIEDQRRDAEAVPAAEKEKYQIDLKVLFRKIHTHAQRDEWKNEGKLLVILGNQQDVDKFTKCLTHLSDDEVAKNIKKIVKEVEKEKQLKAFDDKKNPKQGWMSSWVPWGNKEETDPKKREEAEKKAAQQRAEEQAKIEKFLHETLGHEEQPPPEVQSAEEKNLIDLNFVLEGANIFISAIGPSKNEEGISFYLKQLQTKVNVTTKSKRVEVSLKDIGLSLQTKYFGSTTYVETPMIRRVNYWVPLEADKNFLSLEFDENPKGKDAGMHVKLDLQTMEITYRPAVIDRLTNFFDVSTKDEALKSQALQELEKVQDKASQAASGVAQSTARKFINVNLNAPVIVLPFLQNGDLKSECWVLNLGNLKVVTRDAQKDTDKYYELYTVALTQTRFQYFPSHGLYNKAMKSYLEKGNYSALQGEDAEQIKKVFDVVQDFNIRVEAEKMLPEFENVEETKDKSRLNVDVQIPNISLNLKPNIYKDLLRTGEFVTSKDGQMEIMESNRKKLQQGTTKVGYLFVREKKFTQTVWTKYECLFTKAYLYFFREGEDEPAFSCYIKDSTVFAEDTNEKSHAFKIENRYDQVYLAAETEKDREEWVKIVKQKVDQYALLSKATGSKTDLSQAEQKGKDEKPAEAPKVTDHNIINMNFSFQIKKIGLLVLLDDTKKLFHFETRNFLVKMKQHPAAMFVDLRLDALECIDYLFEYTNPNLKMLMTSNPPGVDPDETDEDLIEVHVEMKEKHHPDYTKDKTAMKVKLQFNYFFVNFKPGTLKEVMKFFIPASPEVAPADAAKNAQAAAKPIETQEIVLTEGMDHVLMDIAVEMKTIGVRLVHEKTYVCLAELALSNTRLTVKMQPGSMEMQGKLGDIQLFDMTNHPDTIDSNLEYQKVRPYQIIGAFDASQDLMELSFCSYEGKHPKADLKTNTFSFANIKIKSIKINHLQQPVMRTLDYLTGQLLPAISPGGPAPIVQMTREVAEKNLQELKFMDLNVSIDTPIILLKPRPDSDLYLELRLGDISVRSERVKDTERFAKSKLDFIYCERFVIKLTDMGFYKVQEKPGEGEKTAIKTRVIRQITFEFFFEKPLFVDEYNFLHGKDDKLPVKNKVDDTMKLVGRMSPMMLTLTHLDYMLLMRCLNFNIAYDDGRDKMLVSDYEGNLAAQNQPGTPMIIDLSFDNLTLLALKDDKVPFAMITLHLMKIVIDRDANKKMKIGIEGADLNGSFFEVEEKQLVERKMMGSLEDQNSFALENVPVDTLLEKIANSLSEYAKKIAKQNEAREEVHRKKTEHLIKSGSIEAAQKLKLVAPLVLEMIMEPNGNKTINIGVNFVRIYLATSAFMTLLAFIGMDESVNPPPPAYAIEEPVQQGTMTVNIEVDDIIVAIPSTKPNLKVSSNVLAIRGDISVLFKSGPEPTLSAVVSSFKGRKFARASEQCAPENEIGCIGIRLKDFEIFICDFRELIQTESFKAVHKRNMILPFSLGFARRTHTVPNQHRNQMMAIIKNDVDLNPMVVRVSYQDILLVNNSLQFQLSQLPPAEEPKPEEKAAAEKKPEPPKVQAAEQNKLGPDALYGLDLGEKTPRELQVTKNESQQVGEKEAKNNWQPNTDEYDIKIKGIKTVLINDTEGMLVPVLDFTLQETVMQMIKLAEGMSISGKLELNCAYFNSLPSRWEPIIENIGLNFELSMGENPKMAFALATNEKFDIMNINVSEKMLATLFSTMATWKANYEQTTTKHLSSSVSSKKKSEEEEDVIDYISPYTIVNRTGYPVELQADVKLDQNSDKYSQELANKLYRIEQEGSAQYKIASDIEQIVKETLNDLKVYTNKVKVRVLHPALHFDQVEGIDIDKPNVIAYPLSSERTSITRTESLNSYKLVSQVKIEKQKKVIVLTSPFTINSQIDRSIAVSLNAGSKNLQLSLAPKGSVVVPIDFIDGTIALHDGSINGPGSEQVALKEFFNGKKASELGLGSLRIFRECQALDQKNGIYEVTLSAPFQVKNCCAVNLCYKLSSEGGEAKLTEILPQETVQDIHLSTEKKTYLQIRAGGYQWSDKVLVHAGLQKEKGAKQIALKDNEGRTLLVEVFTADDDDETKTAGPKPKKLFLYTKTCIINETPYDLEFTYETEKRLINPILAGALAGAERKTEQEAFLKEIPKVTLMGETKNVIIRRRGKGETSKPINVASVGDTNAELLGQNGTSMLELGVNMALTTCDDEQYLMTKIITISPRFILINQVDMKIEIKLEKTDDILAVLDMEKRTPLFWSTWQVSKEKNAENTKRNICVRLIDPNQAADYWNWSHPFEITGIGAYNFFVTNKDRTEKKLLKATVNLQSSIIYVVVDDQPADQVAYYIKNDCESLDLSVYQTTQNPNAGITLKPGETAPWAWTYPNRKKEVIASFTIDNIVKYHSSDLKFSFDALNQIFEHEVPLTKDKSMTKKVYTTVEIEGNKRVLKFYTAKTTIQATRALLFETMISKVLQTVVNMDVEIGLSGIGISLISDMTDPAKKAKERREALYILMRGIEVRMLDTTQNKSTQFRLKYLNIDNNTVFDTTFPVLLTPTKPANLAPTTKEYFVDVLITKKHSTEINFFETVQFLLNETSMSVDGPFINSILEVVNGFTSALAGPEDPDSFKNIYQGLYKSSKEAQKLQDTEYFDSKFDWKTSEVQKYEGDLFIQDLVIHPIFFNLSFQLKRTNTSENAFILLSLLTGALGTALANLDRAPLTLKGIQLHNVFDSQQAIVGKIVNMYKEEATKNVLKLLGSLDIVGNPVGLFNNISTGVVDLFEKPMEGFLKGPLEGGKGLITGAGSLVKNTVSGTFNSISKVTGSLATGVSNLTMDDEYLEEREKTRMKRPKHVGEGLLQGVFAVGKGIFDGVTGLFVKPAKGVAAGGCKGLAKGTYQGVSGLVAKPVAGVLDGVSKTAEGIKNTATLWDQKTNEERLRKPRPFYGKEKVYRSYRAIDAEVLEALRNTEDKAFAEAGLVSSVDLFPDEKDKDSLHILAVTYGPVVYWSAKKSKFLWSFYPKDVEHGQLLEGEVTFNLKQPAKGMNTKVLTIKNPDQEENEFVYTKVMELKDL